MDTTIPRDNQLEIARLRRKSAQRKYRKRLRKVRLLWTVAAALFVLLLVEVFIALCYSPRFWIYRITVKNSETLKDAEVIRLMNLPEHSNYYRLSLGKLARRIESEPRVANAVVQRDTIGCLNVLITERQAVAQLGDTIPLLYMDAGGFVFTRPRPPVTPAPVVEGLAVPLSKGLIGRVAEFPQRDSVLECLKELRGGSENSKLDVARLIIEPSASGASFTFKAVLRQGTILYLGQPTFLREKSACIQQAIIQASKEGHSLEQLSYINVDFVNEKTKENGGVLAIIRSKNSPEEKVEP